MEDNINDSGAMAARKNKRILLFTFLAVFLLSAVMLIIFFPKDDLKSTEKEETEAYYRAHISEFRTPDFSVKAADDTVYMTEYDRRVLYTDGVMTCEFGEDTVTEIPPVAVVSDLLTASLFGDDAAYNALFTADYLRRNGSQKPFTEQKIYETTIALRAYSEENGTASFAVTYKIKDNDGTLRRDIVGNDMREMYVSVIREGDLYKISALSYHFRMR